MPANYSRPQPSYIVISRPNDKRYQLLTRNKKRPATDYLLDLDVGYLIDVANELDVRMDGISLGNLPGVSNPINFNKFLVPDGAGSSTWAFVSAANILDASITGIKLFPQVITARELADGGIPTSKIKQLAITTELLNDESVTRDKIGEEAVGTDEIADGAVITEKIADGAVTDFELSSNAVTTIKILDGNVTLAKLAQDILDRLLPIGTVVEFAGTAGLAALWLECNGQAVSRATYATLFANLGVIYGAGDGATTFNLPDRRGRTAVGIGSDNSTGGRITVATAPSITLGGSFGAETHTLTTPQIPSHNHDVVKSNTLVPGSGALIEFLSPTPPGSGTVTTGNSGGGLPHNNVQPSIFTRYYIRAL